MNQQLMKALQNYPLDGWDHGIAIEKFCEDDIANAVQSLLDTHEQFPVPWHREEEHPGLFIVRYEERFLGFSGSSAPGDEQGEDELPAFGLAVEAFSNSESAAEAIVGTYFS